MSTHALTTLLDVPFLARRLRALGRGGAQESPEIIEKNAEEAIASLLHFSGVVALSDEASAGSFAAFGDRPGAAPERFARPLSRAEAIRGELFSGLASPLEGPHAAPSERELYAHLMEAKVFEGAKKAEREAAARAIAPRYLRPFSHYVPRARRALGWLRADVADELHALGGAAARAMRFDRLFERAIEPSQSVLHEKTERALEALFVRGLMQALEAEPKGHVPLALTRLYEVGGFVHDYLRVVSDLGLGLVDRELDVVRALILEAYLPAPAPGGSS